VKKINVQIVDDSATVRQVLVSILETDPKIHISASSANPIFAQRHMEKLWPDVIVLDLEMPEMDGLTFLKKIMAERPTPVIICSAYAEKGAQNAFEAMKAGAVDILSKPSVGVQGFINDNSKMFIEAVKGAAQVRDSFLKKAGKKTPTQNFEKYDADVILAKKRVITVPKTGKFIAIGSSTGGTNAIEEILSSLPVDSPPLAIVQHMPEKFTKTFAERLNKESAITVKEAEHGDELVEGMAVIAPGNNHMVIKRVGSLYVVHLKDGPLVRNHRPSVDVLFRSVAMSAAKNAVGVILTGMGDDGAAGMDEMHEQGAFTIAQDEETSVVFGMPKMAIQRGCIDKIVALPNIAKEILTS